MELNSKFIELVGKLENIKPVMVVGEFNCVNKDTDMDVRAMDYEAAGFKVNEGDILLTLVKSCQLNRKDAFSLAL